MQSLGRWVRRKRFEKECRPLIDRLEAALHGQEFRALEPLLLHLTGERYADLKWL